MRGGRELGFRTRLKEPAFGQGSDGCYLLIRMGDRASARFRRVACWIDMSFR
jgi:hypothetical protein